MGGRGPANVEEGIGRTDRDLCLHRRESEHDGIVQRQGGMDFDDAVEGGEPGAHGAHAVSTERKPPCRDPALRVGLQRQVDLGSFARYLDPSRQGQPARIRHNQAQFACIALAELAKSKQQRPHPVRHAIIMVQEQTRRSWSDSAPARLTMEI